MSAIFNLRTLLTIFLLSSNLNLTFEVTADKIVTRTRNQAKQGYQYVTVNMSHLEISHVHMNDTTGTNTKSEMSIPKMEEIVKPTDQSHIGIGFNNKTDKAELDLTKLRIDKQTESQTKTLKLEHIHIHQHHVVDHAKNHGVKHHHKAKHARHHKKTHYKWPARFHSFNQFIYKVTEVQQCFYQYVPRNHTIIILYQSLERFPFPIYLKHSDGQTEYNNAKLLSGNFKAQARISGHFRLCVDNIGWGTNRIFLSIRVNSNETWLLSETSNPGAYKRRADMLRQILEVLEISLHQTSALVKQESAFTARRNNIQENDRNRIMWMTWVSLVVALCIYLLQVMETHRLFDQAAAMTTFTMNGGEFKMGKSMV